MVELIVVVGIIAALIAILLPALNAARVAAQRTQDLSNIRQVAIACVSYATENKGHWPLGSRVGPDLTVAGSAGDSLSAINTYTFGWLVQFFATDQIANSWMSKTNGTNLDPAIQKRLCCTSVYNTLSENPGDIFVGNLSERYETSTWTQTSMGFMYWGCDQTRCRGRSTTRQERKFHRQPTLPFR